MARAIHGHRLSGGPRWRNIEELKNPIEACKWFSFSFHFLSVWIHRTMRNWFQRLQIQRKTFVRHVLLYVGSVNHHQWGFIQMKDIKHLSEFGDAFSLLSQNMPKVLLDFHSHVRRRADEFDLSASWRSLNKDWFKLRASLVSCLTPLKGLYTSMLSCYSANSSTLQIRMLLCYNCPWIANIKCRNKTQQRKVGTNATMQNSFSIEVTALMHHPCHSAWCKKLFQILLQIPVHATHPIIPPLHVHEIMSKCDICPNFPRPAAQHPLPLGSFLKGSTFSKRSSGQPKAGRL